MKTEIKYSTTSGEHHVVLTEGAVHDGAAAKQELAHQLRLPSRDGLAGAEADIDSLLRQAQIDPSSVKATFLSE